MPPVDTYSIYRRNGQWLPDRVATVHDPAVARQFVGVRTSRSSELTLYMTGGGYGSGKSTIITSSFIGFPAIGDAVRVDPDVIKGMIPEYAAMTAVGDFRAATVVHEESSVIARRVILEAFANGYDVVYDSSADSGIAKLSAKVQEYRAAGAARVVAEYATPGSIAVAQARANARATAAGGTRRYVPGPELTRNHIDVSQTWHAAATSGVFDSLRLWSTAGSIGQPPALIATAQDGFIIVNDQNAYEEFLRIGGIVP